MNSLPFILVVFMLIVAGVAIFGALISGIVRSWNSRGTRSLPYERVERLFSPAERSFLGVLEQVLGDRYCILGKVRLGDVIRPCKGLSNSARAAALNRVVGKHVDFALCDWSTRGVVGVIELDDASHERETRKRRDEFLVSALAAAGVPLARIKAQKAYTPDEIRRQVLTAFSPTLQRP